MEDTCDGKGATLHSNAFLLHSPAALLVNVEKLVSTRGCMEPHRRCLLLRYDHRLEREPALIFLMYNQLQRHGFSYNVAHADNTIAQRLNELVSSPKFEEVTNALSSNGKEGSELRSFILKAINIGQGVTPFSKGESRMFYTKLLAEVRFRGSPSVWLTMSPSAVDNSLCLGI